MFEQVQPHETWPGGDSIHLAVVRRSPAQFQRQFGITFERCIDDLDEFVVAALELPSGTQVWLEQHAGDPERETLILADISVDAAACVSEVIEQLGIDPQEVRWITPRTNSAEHRSAQSGDE